MRDKSSLVGGPSGCDSITSLGDSKRFTTKPKPEVKFQLLNCFEIGLNHYVNVWNCSNYGMKGKV